LAEFPTQSRGVVTDYDDGWKDGYDGGWEDGFCEGYPRRPGGRDRRDCRRRRRMVAVQVVRRPLPTVTGSAMNCGAPTAHPRKAGYASAVSRTGWAASCHAATWWIARAIPARPTNVWANSRKKIRPHPVRGVSDEPHNPCRPRGQRTPRANGRTAQPTPPWHCGSGPCALRTGGMRPMDTRTSRAGTC